MVKGSNDLMHSYYLYSALLALKLISLGPLASIVNNPEKLQRATISELKHLTPFWLVAALYITTSPDEATALLLMRAFVAARFIVTIGYISRIPKCIDEGAFLTSLVITIFMGIWVVYVYRNAL